MRRSLLSALILSIVPAIALAAEFYQVPHGGTVTINEHGVCREVTNNHASGLATFAATKTANEWSTGSGAFLNALPAGVTVANCGCTVTPGSQSFTTAGSHSFTVPCYNTLTVQVWGAGGGGAGAKSGSTKTGTAGGASNFDGVLIANGGAGGPSTSAGAGGTASGGTTNTTGQSGGTGTANKGGNGANGGAGGAAAAANSHGKPGSEPGGAGSGGRWKHPMTGGGSIGGGGGGGGFTTRAYAAGAYTLGDSVSVVVGAGGTGGNSDYDGGKGAIGRITITWN